MLPTVLTPYKTGAKGDTGAHLGLPLEQLDSAPPLAHLCQVNSICLMTDPAVLLSPESLSEHSSAYLAEYAALAADACSIQQSPRGNDTLQDVAEPY